MPDGEFRIMGNDMDFSIQGSCATRDSVTYILDRARLVGYRARSSILSHMSDPVDFWFDTPGEMPNFEKLNVIADFDKSWRTTPSRGVTVYDFIDERFGVLKLIDGRTVTFSTALRGMTGDNAPLLSHGRLVSAGSQEYFDITSAVLDAFCEVLADKGPAIINVCYWSKADDTGARYEMEDSRGFIDQANRHLDMIYDRIYVRTKANFTSLPRDAFVGSSTHRWGRSPYHWTEDTERKIGEEIHRLLLAL